MNKYLKIALGVFAFFIIICCGFCGTASMKMMNEEKKAEEERLKREEEQRKKDEAAAKKRKQEELAAKELEIGPLDGVPSTCKYTKKKNRTSCVSGSPCPKENQEIICLHRSVPFYVEGQKKEVNNWNKVWDTKQDKLTAFYFPNTTKENKMTVPSKRLGKKGTEKISVYTRSTRNRAKIYLISESARLEEEAGPMYGYGILRHYSAGMISDDLWIEVVDFIDKNEYEAFEAAHKMNRSLNALDGKAKRKFGKPIEDAYDEFQKANRGYFDIGLHTLLTQNKITSKELESRGLRAKKERLNAEREELENNSYLRLSSIAVPQSIEDFMFISKHSWVLPTKSRCGKKPTSNVDFERTQKKIYLHQITAPYYKIKLNPNVRDYIATQEAYQVRLMALHSFSLTGKTKFKKSKQYGTYCCFLNDCEQKSLFSSCDKPRRQVEKFEGYRYDWNDDIQSKTIMLKGKPNKRPSRLEAEAIVRIKSVTRICSKYASGSDQRFTGEVAGIRIKQEGKVVFEEAYVDIPVEEALKGSKQWIKEQQ